MKRTIFLVMFCMLTVTFAQGQSRDVRRANTQLNRGNVANAKEMIDKAMENPSAQNDPASLLLKAKVYMEVYLSQDPEVRTLDPNPLEVAYQAINTARENDVENKNIIEIQQSLLVLSELVFNNAVEAFNDADYSVASERFLRSYRLSENFGAVDTTTLYNAALAAEMAREYKSADKMYKQLIGMKYDQPFMYSSMSVVQMALGDTTEATRYIKMGREIYPDELNLIFSEANIYIFSGQIEDARKTLNIALEKDPMNPNLHFAFAANYDKMAQDTIYPLEERLFAFKEAEKSYKKAIELDENYFDAIYNLGVLYFNEGIRIFEEADAKLRKNPTAAGFKEYEMEESKFRDQWLVAQPYLEKAMSMIDEDDPNLEVVVVSLLQLYARTNQPEKLERMQDLYHKHFSPPEEN